MVDLEVFIANDDPPVGLVLDVYVGVYAEPPYLEGPAEVGDFAGSWPRRVAAPGFRVVVARDAGRVIGFTFGHELGEHTGWWSGALGPLEVDTVEWPGRTFAVIELAVLADYRRRGIAARLHAALLADVKVERVTLAVRPEVEAAPAREAYAAWGYRKVGQIRPYTDAPVYDAMVADR